ncbi:MAG: DUF502 domain-containing protein [Pseudomonadota bacterium]
MSGLRNSFLAGIVVAAPITITVALIYWFVTTPMAWIDVRVRELIPAQWASEQFLLFSIPGMGVVVAIVVLTVLGAMAKNLFGRALINLGEQIVDSMPVVRNLYRALKQIFETVLSQTETSFKEVALVEYPRKGTWAIGFVAATAKGEVQHKTEGDMVNVFVPTTPNPTSGFLLFVDRNDLVPLEMSVEEAAKAVISAGLVVPNYTPPPEPAAADPLDAVPELSVEEDLAESGDAKKNGKRGLFGFRKAS